MILLSLYSFFLFGGVVCVSFRVSFDSRYGDDPCYSYPESIQETSDDGFIFTGYTGCYGSVDKTVMLGKYSINGTLEWLKTLGDEFNYENGLHILVTSDTGFVIAGKKGNYDGNEGVILAKFEAGGNLEWIVSMYGFETDYSASYIDQDLTDGGYILVGNGENRVLVVKCDVDGDIIWGKTFWGSTHSIGKSVKRTSDVGYIVSGVFNYTSFYKTGDMFLLKLSRNGSYEWGRLIKGNFYNSGDSVLESQSDLGNIVVFGHANYNVFREGNIILMKFDLQHGTLLWITSVDLLENYYIIKCSIQPTSDGGYVGASGESLIKYNGNGEILWMKHVKDISFLYGITSVRESHSLGHFIISGYDGSMQGGPRLRVMRDVGEGDNCSMKTTDDYTSSRDIGAIGVNVVNATSELISSEDCTSSIISVQQSTGSFVLGDIMGENINSQILCYDGTIIPVDDGGDDGGDDDGVDDGGDDDNGDNGGETNGDEEEDDKDDDVGSTSLVVLFGFILPFSCLVLFLCICFVGFVLVLLMLTLCAGFCFLLLKLGSLLTSVVNKKENIIHVLAESENPRKTKDYQASSSHRLDENSVDFKGMKMAAKRGMTKSGSSDSGGQSTSDSSTSGTESESSEETGSSELSFETTDESAEEGSRL